MNLRGINRIILSYVIEILCVLVFVVFSFFVFGSNKLESYAMIAKNSSTYNYDRQTSFTPYTLAQLNEVNEDELLLAGTLDLENVYDKERTYDVVLYLDNAIDVENIRIYINGVLVENITFEDDSIVITKVTLKEHEKESMKVLVYGTYAQEYFFKLI